MNKVGSRLPSKRPQVGPNACKLLTKVARVGAMEEYARNDGSELYSNCEDIVHVWHSNLIENKSDAARAKSLGRTVSILT